MGKKPFWLGLGVLCVILAFQNCGQSFKSVELPNSNNSLLNPGLPGDPSASPTPTTNPNPTPSPTPVSYPALKNVWSALSSTAALSSRYNHSAVSTGSRVIFFGGESNEGGAFVRRPDGAIFDPANNSWSPIQSVSMGQARWNHTATWTGSRMIVFGGFPLEAGRSDGRMYDPALNQWTEMTTNGPISRIGHSAIWTGTRLIVWGGRGSQNNVLTHLADGGVYNPATDTWEAISTVGAPSARSNHTAVWTGSRMIVFGGYFTGANGVFQPLNSGGIYDPATNTWAALNQAGAPTPRTFHTATWTGSKMIIFGGLEISALTAANGDGGIFDPATNSWTATNIANSPSARADHTAVWTGEKLIVFGGYRSNNGTPQYLRDGGIFDPLTNTWTATSLTGAPSARTLPAAAWAASKMIIFGGDGTFNVGGVLADGGIFD